MKILANILFTFGISIALGAITSLIPNPVFSAHADIAKPACTTAIIASSAGPICGTSLAFQSGKQVQAFMGIPFAESTAHANRWQAPVPKAPWATPFIATQFGPICPQSGAASTLAQSEDCLSLNIWVPAGASADAKLPVMVFIYGGGFSSGYSASALYDGSYIAANKPVIVVSLNYRVGVLGFLAADGLTGNYGFMDQQLALTWVQQNIQSFGGNPAQVTLFGESAGAMSVGLHLFSAPGSAALFRAGIMESNFFALPYKSLADQINVGNIFKQGLNCRDLECLRNADVNALLVAESAFTPQMSTVFSGAKYYIPFTPVIDGRLLTRQPVSAAAGAKLNKPILMGTNKNEAVVFVHGQPISTSAYSAWAASLFGQSFQKVIAKYPAQEDRPNSALWASVQTDNFLTCSTRYVAAHAAAPVYAYVFNHQPSFNLTGVKSCNVDDNVCHTVELPFVFHTASAMGVSFTDEERQLSTAIIDYWTNFAIHLNPNGNTPRPPGLTHWPKFTAQQKNYMLLDTKALSVAVDPYQGVCDFWDTIGYDLIYPWK
ncbi:MAG: carboxylesterase family protein [Methylovulum sp.]|nr:carboxylesterase family protein [Methylovulum sp.]